MHGVRSSVCSFLFVGKVRGGPGDTAPAEEDDPQLAYYEGRVQFDHIGLSGTACVTPIAAAPSIPANDTVLIEDTTPAGVTVSSTTGSSIWQTAQKTSGTSALIQVFNGPSGTDTIRFSNVNAPIASGDSAVAYVLINECAPTREIRLMWWANGARQAYWGERLMSNPQTNDIRMADLPPAGVWTRLEVPFSQLGLSGTMTAIELGSYGGEVWFDHIGTKVPPAVLTGFSADHASPQAAGTALTWTATAAASIPPAQYRFERQDAGTWSSVQAYSNTNTYTWTPSAADVGDHAVRVSVRNSGSAADFEDTRTLSMTITNGSGLLSPAREGWLARLLNRRTPVSLSVTTRYTDVAPSDLKRYSVYTPELNLMAETDAAPTVTPAIAYEYIWFGGTPVAQVDVATNTIHWTFTDHLGTPIAQTDAMATVDWRAEYDPYGTMHTLRAGATRHQPLRFPGQEYDEGAAEREYNIFRWYRAGWGRYTQADPIGLQGQDMNLYRYALADPTTYVDPLGLDVRVCCRQFDSTKLNLNGASGNRVD